MKRIISLALVLVMIASMLPMTFMSAAAESVTAPATLPNGAEYATSALFTDNKSFTYGTDYNAYSSWIGVTGAADAVNADGGIMFKVNTSAAAAGDLNFAFQLKVIGENGRETRMFSHSDAVNGFYGAASAVAPQVQSTWYTSNDGAAWSQLKTPTPTASVVVVAPLTTANEEFYVYIPYSSMYIREGATYMGGGENVKTEPGMCAVDARELVGGWQTKNLAFMLCTTGSMSGAVFSDFRFVSELEASEPVLANGYTTLSLFSDPNKTIAMNDTNSTAGKWLGTTSAADLYTGFNSGDGIMFKVDASNVPAGDDYLELMIMMSITTANGKGSYVMLHSGGVNGYYTDAKKPTTPSQWYVSADGVNWSVQKDSSDAFRKPVTNYRGVTYIYVPFSEMYMRHSLEYFATGTNDPSKPGASFLEVKELCGGWANAQNMIQFYQDKTNPMSAATISGVSFVFAKKDASDAPTLTTPEVLPDGTSYKSYGFFSPDKKLTVGNTTDFPHGNYTDYPYMNTVKNTNSLNGNGGVMFKVDASAAASGSVNLTFRFTVAGNNGVSTNVFSHGGAVGFYGADFGQKPTTASTWYVTKDGTNWETVEAPGTAFSIPLAMAGEAMYVYIPYSSLYFSHGETFLKGGDNNHDDTIVPFLEGREMMGGIKPADASLQLCVSGGANGTTFSEFQFVTEPAVVSAPTTLPDGKAFVTESLFSNPEQQIALDGDLVNKWIGTTSGSVLGNGFNNATGIMFKIDASNVPAGSDVLSLMMMMSITGANGTGSNVMLHSGGVSGYYADAQKPNPSTWYISIDGGDWTAIKDNTNNFRMPVGGMRSEIYVYVPFSEMYMRHSIGHFTGSGNDSTQPGASFLEAGEACGGWAEAANNIQILPTGGAMCGAVLSELAFVFGSDPIIETPADIFSSVSISLTDDITYNIYANIPEGATNVTMTFSFNGVTYVATGVEQENGTVKYALKYILPQQMGKEIVATWSAIVDGEIVTDTYSNSIENYLKSLLSNPIYSDSHNLATALLHYGAAAQNVADSTDALVNENVAALPHPTVRAELPYYINIADSAKSIWKTVALRLDGAIALKIGVAAPRGITQVQYTIGDTTDVVSIKNGYVYIPVYAYQMMDKITVNLYDGFEITDNGALEISVSYYLSVAQIEDAEISALLDTIANYAAQATIAVGGRVASTEKAYSTVAQLALYDTFGGTSNVIQLTDGSYIIIDGGVNEKVNEDALWAYLWRNNGYTKPVISAWIFTHLDLDHTGLGFAFLNKYKDKITVNTIGYTFPDDYQTLLAIKNGDSEKIQGYKNSAIGLQTERLAVFETIKKAYPNTEFWDMEKGQVKNFADVQAKILLSANEVTHPNPFEHNSFSAVIQFVFTQNTASTADDTTFLTWGDSDGTRVSAAESQYGAALKSDVMEAAHHALAGGVKSAYQKVKPSISLLSVWESKLKNEYKDNETDAYGYYWTVDYNKYLRENSDCYFHDTTAVVNMADLTVSIWQ